MIEVGECDFEAVAYGEPAQILAGCRSGTFVTIYGSILGHQWKVGGGKQRCAAEIRAETIEIGPRSEEKK